MIFQLMNEYDYVANLHGVSICFRALKRVVFFKTLLLLPPSVLAQPHTRNPFKFHFKHFKPLLIHVHSTAHLHVN